MSMLSLSHIRLITLSYYYYYFVSCLISILYIYIAWSSRFANGVARVSAKEVWLWSEVNKRL